jgi:hypothetical protein
VIFIYTPVKLDRMRNFRYGMRAIHLIEKTLGITISKLNFEDLTQHQLAVLVWAGLHHEDKGLSPDIVMDLVDDHSTITEITSVMSEAFAASFGSDDPGKKKTAAN